jgi:hypothetical protein
MLTTFILISLYTMVYNQTKRQNIIFKSCFKLVNHVGNFKNPQDVLIQTSKLHLLEEFL